LLGSPLPLTHSLSIPSTGTSILESTMSRSGGVERDWNSADEVVSDAEQEDGRLASISDLIKSRISTRANSYDYECNDDEIRALLISHPEVATSCTTEELTRLLQCKEVTVDTVRILYEACPNAFRDLRSYDTLAYLALRPEKVDVACYLADVCPSLIIPTDAELGAGSYVTTPLHLACERETQNWQCVVSDVHSATVPTALSFIGRHCPLSTMFSALKAFPLVVQNGGYDGYGEDETDSSSCRRAKKQRM